MIVSPDLNPYRRKQHTYEGVHDKIYNMQTGITLNTNYNVIHIRTRVQNEILKYFANKFTKRVCDCTFIYTKCEIIFPKICSAN